MKIKHRMYSQKTRKEMADLCTYVIQFQFEHYIIHPFETNSYGDFCVLFLYFDVGFEFISNLVIRFKFFFGFWICFDRSYHHYWSLKPFISKSDYCNMHERATILKFLVFFISFHNFSDILHLLNYKYVSFSPYSIYH